MTNHDPAHIQTDREILRLEGQLRDVYSEAYNDLERKLNDFNERHRVKEAKYAQQLADGVITQADYDDWMRGQVFQGKQWEAKKEEIAQVLYNANTVAANIVNETTPNVFAFNANYMAYDLEHGAGVNFGFGLYDTETVKRLIKDDPDLLPKWKIDEPKDYTWNYKGLKNVVTQGIIQGERLDQITNRISRTMAMRNMNTARTFSRTAMTGAQNAGRQYRLTEARNMGIKLKKEWMATLDSHTRDSHADVDGEKVDVDSKFSNGLEYPGEPGGAPAEVYNCRCTMVADLVDFPSSYQRYDNVDGKRVDNMSYREWEEAKGKTHKIADKVMASARRAEALVTRDLMQASALGSGHLEGLDFRFKGRGSLERKIVDKSAKKGISQDEYAIQITDALRYTNLSDPETLTNDFFNMRNSLEGKGYSMVEISNTLKERDAEYRGINTLVQTPSGYTFELQFHTPQSLEIKEVNHLLYEEQRLATTTESRKKELGLEMMNNAHSIVTPINVETIDNKLLDVLVRQW